MTELSLIKIHSASLSVLPDVMDAIATYCAKKHLPKPLVRNYEGGAMEVYCELRKEEVEHGA